jgi:peptide chain release factor 1
MHQMEDMMRDPSLNDASLQAEMQEDYAVACRHVNDAWMELVSAVLFDPSVNVHEAAVEIRSSTGGEESGLFAKDLFKMYQRFCERHAIKVRIDHAVETEQGAYKVHTLI